MARSRARLLRIVRVRVRRALRSLDRGTPEWMRWLTPWGSSLALHAVGLLVLAIAIVAHSRPERASERAIEGSLPPQLVDDLTSLRPAEVTGDPFADSATKEPPSLSLDPKPDGSAATNVAELPANFLLGRDLQLTPPTDRKTAPGSSAGAGMALANNASLSAPFSGRQGPARARLVRREGGSVESERAVERGLDWLARHQRADGSWSLDHKPQCSKGKGCPAGPCAVSDTAATGLALLPLLGAGQSHVDPGRYQKAAGDGIRWLLKAQKPDGDLWVGEGNTHMYAHAIGAMALCEAFGITRDERLRGPAQRAVSFIVAAQNPQDGGWRYNPGEAGDTCVLGWQMFALRSAQMAGLKVPDDTIRRCVEYLDRAAGDPDKATYAYQPGTPVSAVMTAEALLVRQYLGWGRAHAPLQKGATVVAADLFASKERNIYYWYYATQLLHNMQGPTWRKWNVSVRDGLVNLQVKGTGCDRGSWDPARPSPDRWGKEAGRHFTTALSVLTLEVYYRYLPLYRTQEDGARDAAAK